MHLQCLLHLGGLQVQDNGQIEALSGFCLTLFSRPGQARYDARVLPSNKRRVIAPPPNHVFVALKRPHRRDYEMSSSLVVVICCHILRINFVSRNTELRLHEFNPRTSTTKTRTRECNCGMSFIFSQCNVIRVRSRNPFVAFEDSHVVCGIEVS